MLTGFLATLEDGFSLSSNVSQQAGGSTGSRNHATGGVGGGLFQSLFRINIAGGIESTSDAEDREEYSFILQHTEASLFNRCRSYMRDHDISTVLTIDCDAPEIGDIVEIRGVLHRNPLHDLLELVSVFSSPNQSQSNVGRSRGQNQGTRAASVQAVDAQANQIMKILSDSLQKANLSDFVLTTNLDKIPNVILTLRRSVDIDAALDLSVGGVCSVIGKVTNSYTESEEIPLYRRTLLQYMPSDQVREMFSGLEQDASFNFDVSKIVVTGGIQVLPLAIFI